MTVNSLFADLLGLKKDPLTDKQKLKIKAFVDEYWLTQEDVPIVDIRSNNIAGFRKKHILEEKISQWAPTLSKTYDSHQPRTLLTIKEKFDGYHRGAKDFEKFRRIYKNPLENASEFDLEPYRPDHALSAQVFMKIILQKYVETNGDFSTLKICYKNKISQTKAGYVSNKISRKYSLLLQNEPIQKLDRSKIPSFLDIILSHVHFFDPKIIDCKNSKGNCTLKRKEVRNIIKNLFEEQYNNPDLRHAFEAFAILLHCEKGQILISHDAQAPKELSIPYRTVSPSLDRVSGFYNSHHTIIISSLFDPFNKTICTYAKGTIVHEMMHFLFFRIVQNYGSPVHSGSKEEKEYDQAIAKDQAHRKTLINTRLKYPESSVWSSIVTGLETNTYIYFREDNGASHQLIMRMELIVRIMELLAEGIPHEAIRKIAPHLYDFYFQYSKPMLEKFVSANKSTLLDISKHNSLIFPSRQQNPVAEQPQANATVRQPNGTPLKAQVAAPLRQQNDASRQIAAPVRRKAVIQPTPNHKPTAARANPLLTKTFSKPSSQQQHHVGKPRLGIFKRILKRFKHLFRMIAQTLRNRFRQK